MVFIEDRCYEVCGGSVFELGTECREHQFGFIAVFSDCFGCEMDLDLSPDVMFENAVLKTFALVLFLLSPASRDLSL